MFGRKRKQKESEPELSQVKPVDHEYSQPVPYWRGPLVYTWWPRLRDFLNLWFRGGRAIMILRVRKDRRMDHCVFIPKSIQQDTINWGSETYDIEEDAIIRDNGRTIMFVIEGCRKPVKMTVWHDVCNSLADSENATLTEYHLKKYGKVSFSSRGAHVKMNNRDAEKIVMAGKSKYAEYACYLSGIGALCGVVLVLMMLGMVPSAVYGILEGFQQIFMLNRDAIMAAMGV